LGSPVAGGAPCAPPSEGAITPGFESTHGTGCLGTDVRLSSTATGRPPLTYTWRVVSPAGITVATLAGASATWNTLGQPPGIYLAYLDVRNSVGTATSAPVPITILPGPLSFGDGYESGTTAAWAAAVP
jgi:hypothetical protein